MQKPLRKFDNHDNITNEFFINIGQYIKSIQLESGAIPSDEDKNHDPWDHIESIMGLNFVKEIDSSKLAFQWLIDMHNEVNKLNNKKIYSYEEVNNYYLNLYNSGQPDMRYINNQSNYKYIIYILILSLLFYIFYNFYISNNKWGESKN